MNVHNFQLSIYFRQQIEKRMKTTEIIEILKERKTDFLKIKLFSDLPGIYALFYTGQRFPFFNEVPRYEIIYIGKTESSQLSRDARTHFTSGKTGSSTVRKSIGSLLYSTEKLNPIPRNEIDYKKGRFSQFKFDEQSEEKITQWMKNNLAISFYEFPKSKQDIDDLETDIIMNLTPILNIEKNPRNIYRNQLKNLRKICALKACNNYQIPENIQHKINNSHLKINITEAVSNSIYIDNLTEVDVKGKKIRILTDSKYLFPQEVTGKPLSYELFFITQDKEFVVTYTIGSNDGKSRSGILKFSDDIYAEILKIKTGTRLKISKFSDDKYTIEKK
jgi:hypothetical protein